MQDLSTCVSWQRVAQALDLPCLDRTLPALTGCPVCQEHRLTIYHDPRTGGEWFYCSGCVVGGDMIELIARAWDCDPDVALLNAHHLGLRVPLQCLEPEALVEYSRKCIDRRRRINCALGPRSGSFGPKQFL